MNSADEVTDAICAAFRNHDWNLLKSSHLPGLLPQNWENHAFALQLIERAGATLERWEYTKYRERYADPYWVLSPKPAIGLRLYFKIAQPQLVPPAYDISTWDFPIGESDGKFGICNNEFVANPGPRKLKVDLQVDRPKIADFIDAAVLKYVAKQKQPVSALELHYSVIEGFVALSLYTEPDYTPGKCGFLPNKQLRMKHWSHLCSCRSATITLMEGDALTLPEQEDEDEHEAARMGIVGEVTKQVGQLLVGLLKDLRGRGAFATLQRREEAELGVEEMEGNFGWPEYGKRRQDNLL